MFRMFSNQVVRSFKQGIPVKAADKALNPFNKFFPPVSKNSAAIKQQIQDKLDLNYKREDLSILDNKRVIVDKEAMEKRIFDQVFKKPSNPLAGQQAAIARKKPKTK